MASNVVSDNFETGSGGVPQLGGADRQTQWCKAWVNFNGTGTVAIRDSYNVSSITDNGTGNYRVNYTNNMTNIHYSSIAACEEDAGGYNRSASASSTATNYTDVRTFNTGTNALFDAIYVKLTTHSS